MHFFRQIILTSLILGNWLTMALGATLDETLPRAAALREQGDFKGAAALLKSDGEKFSVTEQKQIAYQADLLERIRQDYSLKQEELFQELNKSLRNLTKEEFAKWIHEGRFDSRMIDGVRYFTGTSVSNLYFRYPELNARRRAPKNDAHQKAVLENCRAIKMAAQKENKFYVLPRHFKATMTVTAEAKAAPSGEMIRAWLPVPRQYPFQTDFKMLSSSSPVKYLADETSPIRSAYFEQIARKGQPTEFQISYEYITRGIHFDLASKANSTAAIKTENVNQFTQEAPHVVFTDKIKKLAQQLAGDETDKTAQAKKFYDWIAGNIKYSFAREYSTLTNISDYCYSNGYGDCGQEALLFITLCRSQGIPARWQTGWFTFPNAKSIHDWTEIYLAEQGWVPVDPYMGIFAMRYATSLSENERREVRDFYFGGLDQYRMIANSDHNQTLQPPKKTWRSDDVDFQRGELESGEINIYFDKYSFDLKVEELPRRTK
ncbi:MAG: transglutaminase-like domain-containing protein [Verrucomicrobiota bacterium]|nr:transglutaminase-like domain-containing protein [Verrucomicrobiota bacterium]